LVDDDFECRRLLKIAGSFALQDAIDVVGGASKQDGDIGRSLCMTIAGLRTCERPTAWVGWEDSNSEMSSQIILLETLHDLRESSRILALETIRV
jgi:hypothetical protein